MPYQTLQYQIKAEPIPLGAAERSTPDKWQGQTNSPTRKAPFLVALATSAAFVPVVSASPAPVYVGGQSCEPIAVKSFQYSSEAKPLVVSVSAETITPDKWDRPQSQPQAQTRRNQYQPFFGEGLPAYTPQVYVAGQQPGPIPIVSFQYSDEAKPITIPAAQQETVTQDKWDRGQSQPLARAKRAVEYRAFVTSNSSLVAPERPDVDKWVVRLEQPRQDVKRQQWIYPSLSAECLHVAPSGAQVYVSGVSCDPIRVQGFQYPSTAGPVITQSATSETVTPDKWKSEQDHPQAIRRGLFTGSVIDPSGLLAGERPSIDKWLGGRSEPARTPRRTGLDPGTASLQFVVAAPTVYVGSQPVGPIAIRWFQYEANAEPLKPIATVPETVTADKWLAHWPQPYFRPKRLIQYGVNCAIAEQADDGLPPVHWIPPVVQPYPYRKLIAREGFSVTARLHVAPPPEAITLDKWAQQTQRPRWDLKRLQRLYPVSVSDQLFNVPSLPAVYISGSAPGPIATRAFQYPSTSRPVAFGVETITLDKWLLQGESPTRVRRPILSTSADISPVESVTVDKWLSASGVSFSTRRLMPLSVSDVFTLEVISVDKWHRSHPDLVFQAKRLRDYSQFSIDPTLTGERISLDKWALPVQDLRRDLARRQYVYPVSVSDYLAQVPGAEAIRLDKWGKNYPDVIFRVPRLREHPQFAIDPTLTAERTTLDKWLSGDQSPRRDVARRHHLAANADLLTQIETITVDKWSKQHVDIVSRIARLRDYTQFTIDPTLTAERASLDKWVQPTQQPRFDLKRNQWNYPALAIDSQFYLIPPVEIIRLDKWVRQYPDLVFRAKRFPDYSYFSVDPTLRDESVSIDRWAQAPSEPRFIKRAIQQGDAVLYVPESISLDKWNSPQPEPRRGARRPTQTVDVLLVVPEPITLDKWVSTESNPRRIARRAAPSIDSLLFVSEGITPDKWTASQTGPRLLGARRFIQTGDGLLFVPESVTLDKWMSDSLIGRLPRRPIQQPSELIQLVAPPLFAQSVDPQRPRRIVIIASPEVLTELRFTEWRDLVQPFMPRDIDRMQYFYALYSAGTDISLTIEGGIVVVVPVDDRVIEVKPDPRIIEV